jgi:molybdate transport system substrate-binding protein
MRFTKSVFASLASAVVALAVLAPAVAAERTPLVVLVPSNIKAPFTEVISMYEKAHPDVTIQPSFVGSTTIVKEVESGAAVDVVVISDLTVTPNVLRFIDRPAPLYDTHSVIALSRAAQASAHAVKIASPQDLAKPGVRFAMGTPGSGVAIWQNQNIDMLDKLYGSGFAAKVRANVQATRTDSAHLSAALDEGLVDAALLFTSDIDAKMTKIDLPAAQQVTVTFGIAPVKATQHAAPARDFIAYLMSAEAKGVYRAHGLTAR